MQFNPELKKKKKNKPKKFIFSRKTLKPTHQTIHFNDSPVDCADIQKYHIKEKLLQAMKEMSLCYQKTEQCSS